MPSQIPCAKTHFTKTQLRVHTRYGGEEKTRKSTSPTPIHSPPSREGEPSPPAGPPPARRRCDRSTDSQPGKPGRAGGGRGERAAAGLAPRGPAPTGAAPRPAPGNSSRRRLAARSSGSAFPRLSSCFRPRPLPTPRRRPGRPPQLRSGEDASGKREEGTRRPAPSRRRALPARP